jgi:ADP-heptose:LPS heptosyltransferase
MATPAIRALRRARVDARIEVLTSPWGAPAIRDNPDIDRVRTVEATWFEPLRAEGPDPSRLIADVLSLRLGGPGRYDAAADLRGDFRSILLALASGARRRAGFSRLGLEALLTDSLPFDARLDHVARNHAVARLLGAGALEERRPVFVVPASAEAAVERLLAPLPAGRAIVTIHPGTNRPSANWGAERFAETARQLASRGGISILAGGLEVDRPQAETVLRASGMHAAAVLNLAGRTSLAEGAAVIRRSSVLLTNDSGAAHLAAAVGTPVVAIFGPTDPALSWTWDRPDRNIALAGPSTCPRPCFARDCGGDHGYSRIAPADVAALIGALLESGTEKGDRR